MILSGEKTVTWRLFDDKDLQIGDVMDFLNWETKEKFAEAEIIHIREKPLGKITESDYFGHEKFENNQVMLEHYRKYYGGKVSVDTKVNYKF